MKIRKSVTSRLRFSLGSNGSEIAELAMILPLLFMILMAIFWFGQAFRIYGTLTQAARQGARAAVARVCTTCTVPAGTGPGKNAQTAAQNVLSAAHLDPNPLLPWGGSSPKWTPVTMCLCRSGAGGSCSSVPCDPAVANMCVQENVQLSYPNLQGGMGSCGTSVSMRYQLAYHFYIPFTNVDMLNIQFPGQAQMRLETQ